MTLQVANTLCVLAEQRETKMKDICICAFGEDAGGIEIVTYGSLSVPVLYS